MILLGHAQCFALCFLPSRQSYFRKRLVDIRGSLGFAKTPIVKTTV